MDRPTARERREHVRANPNNRYVVKAFDQGRKGVLLRNGFRVAQFYSLYEAKAVAEILNGHLDVKEQSNESLNHD